MKRKAFLIVILALVLCLTCGMLFVACNDNNGGDDGGKKPGPPSGDDDETIDPEMLAAWDAMIDALDGVRTDDSKEFAFGLEISERGEGEVADERIFGVAFENYAGKDYIYGVAGKDGKFASFNGFDLGHVIMTVLDDWLGLYGESIAGLITLDAAAFKSDGIAGTMVTAYVADWAKEGTSYMFEIDLAELVTLIAGDGTEDNPGLVDLDSTLAGFLGEETLATVIDTLGGLLGIEETADLTVSGLLMEVANNYSVKVYFGFDDVAATADAENADPFDGLMEGVADARKLTAKNLLNFSLDGTAQLRDEKGEPVADYVINVDMDIDIFQLLGILDYVKGNGCLLDGTAIDPDFKLSFNLDDTNTLEKIVEMVENLGYINITVDQVGEDNKPTKNILTIYSDFSEGNALVQLNSEEINAILAKAYVALGGVYDFDTLASYIENAVTGALGQADEEGGFDVMGLLTGILDVLNLDLSDLNAALADIKANGVNIDMNGLVDMLVELVPDLSLASSFLPALWHDAATLNIQVRQASYGTADTSTEMAELYAMKSTPSAALVSEVTKINGLPSDFYALFPTIGLGQTYTLEGKSLVDNSTVTFDGYVIGYDALDVDWSKKGPQNVTLYVAAANQGKSLVELLNGSATSLVNVIDLSGYPVFGIYSVDVTLNLSETSAEASNVKIVGHEDGAAIEYTYAAQPVKGAKTAFSWLKSGSNVTLSYNKGTEAKTIVLDEKTFNKYCYIVDAKGNVVANAFDAENNVVVPAGTYKIVVDVNGYKAEVPLNVSTVAVSAVSDAIPVLGAKYDYTVKAELTSPDGEVTECDITSLSYNIGSKSFYSMHQESKDFADIGEVGENRLTVTLNKDLALVGLHKATVSVKANGVTISSLVYEFGTVETPADAFAMSGVSSVYFGNAVSVAIEVGDKTYSLSYNAETEKWEAKTEDGTVLKDIVITMRWDDAEEGVLVVGDANGFITNWPDEDKSGSRSTRVYVTAERNGYYFSDNFYAYELSASNKQSSSAIELGSKLDGFVSNVNQLNSNYAFKWGAEGYGIYNGEELVVAVTVKVYQNDKDVTATAIDANGNIALAGSFKIEYALTYNGVQQKFFHLVDVTPFKAGTGYELSVGMTLEKMLDVSALGAGYTVKYDATSDSYGIYNGDTLAYEVTADVRKGKYSFSSKYTLVNGTIAESGDFFVTFEIEYGTSTFEVEIGAINIPAAQTPEA